MRSANWAARPRPLLPSQDLVSAEAPADVPPPAFDLGALFAQPANLRQAILMQEILQRPEHRWERMKAPAHTRAGISYDPTFGMRSSATSSR